MSWFGGLFGSSKNKSKNFNLSKLSDQEIETLNSNEKKKIAENYDLHKWDNYNFQTQISEKNGLVGLDNLGNTCFMNSALQCMSNTDCLTAHLLSNEWMNHINCVNQIGSQGHVLCAYSDLLRKLWIGYKESSISPRNFKRMIANFNSVYGGYDQQDSQEFVSFLMDT